MPSTATPRELQILIIDDDDVDRERVRRCLHGSTLCAHMMEADSGNEAMRILRNHSVDCVLLDNCLGDTTGSALLRAIRELTSYDGPIIMVTGAGSESLVVEAMQEGATDYVPKVQLDAERLTQAILRGLQLQENRAAKDAAARELAHRLAEQERTLRQLDRTLQDILDQAPNAIAYWDQAGRIRFGNVAHQAWFGIAPQQLADMTAQELLGPALHAIHAPHIRLALQGQPQQFEHTIPAQGEHAERIARVEYRPDKDEHGRTQGFYVTWSDLTELAQARDAAQESARLKSAFLANMSHEIRTPMNAILGLLRLTLDKPLTNEVQGDIGRAHEAALALMGILDDILDHSKLEAGQLRIDPQALVIDELVRRSVDLFSGRTTQKGLSFHVDIDAQVPTAVMADGLRLSQVLNNLLGNAVKFTARGEVRLRVRYRREMAVFEVEDTGPGIAAADLARVFEPFVRSSAQPVADAPGSGLGLTIAKMLTDLMGGEMTARSAPGQGTCFRCRLFLPEVYAEAQAAGLPQRAALAGVCGYAGARRTVLVVDNEEADRQLLVRWLEPLGFRVHTAMHGEDALAQLARGLRPDVVFMDLAMPGIDGWETLHRMQQLALQPRPVCAVVSANAFDKGLDNPVGLRADDFLVKPVRRQDLLHWMAGRLALAWVHGEAPGPNPDAQAPAAGGAPPVPPPDLDAEALGSLLELARLGYYRGFVKRLEALQALHPGWAPWLQHLQAEARAFRFEALTESLTESLQGLRLPPDPKKERDALE